MQEDVYRSGIRKNLNRILQELTDDGKLDFESVPYQNLKAEIEKRDEECTEVLCKVLLETASRSGCADRQFVLQLFNEYFCNSSLFRDQILNDPKEFIEIMLETDPIRNPLPGSKSEGNELKSKSLAFIKNWEKMYAKNDARMKCLAVTLRKTKFVDYENGEKKIEEERKRREFLDERRRMIVERTLSLYKSKFEEIKEDVERLKMELETTMEMLVPSFTNSDDVDIPMDIPSTSSKSFELVIEDLSPLIKVNADNDAIVEAFLGAKTVLIHRVQTMRKLAKGLLPLKGAGESLAQSIIDYRDVIKKLVLKADEIRIKTKKKPVQKAKKFDDDFIDVEISIDDILMVQYANEASEDVKEDVKEPEKKLANPKKEEPKVKFVSFGLDLKYWGEERKDVEVPKNNADCHRFWRSADESTVAGTVHDTVYTQRQFTFVGEAPKIDRECLAKLPSGALCKRKDMFKCPLHGPLVDRDANGKPVKDEDRLKEIDRKERKRLKEAEEFSRKIVKEYESKTKRKRKHEEETSVRSRLQKKLFDPKTIQRVSADITSQQRSRLEKNFSHQFSHL
ncbi:Protein CBG20579 [Caenorhabditis briggsae]|uniref:UV-stimulated scaffold protein A homolog n=1 Tax=Caenorhabditis briggsae TaxID=6238 RepID=UVSSA_CAEBR|nr:Protein CBG20579 [Caenorhabditis briggsae]A8XY47.1 RecName: Full=UV-stimulated scaffold protein A homolog [Caenorhabditis briggsae]CAP37564.1 Protein CBG20579 [Caenorhabditis briggsae]